MQLGWVERHGRGWRGVWRDGGHRTSRRHYTAIVRRKGEARRLLEEELRLARRGIHVDRGLTLSDLTARFHAQHTAAPRTVEKLHTALLGPLKLWGHLHPDQLTPAEINQWLTSSDLRPLPRSPVLR